MEPAVPEDDVLPEPRKRDSSLIKPARTFRKAMQAYRRRAKFMVWMDEEFLHFQTCYPIHFLPSMNSPTELSSR